jgi:hypothetical protein
LFEESVLEVGTEDMMAVLDSVDNGSELAAHPAVEACAEDFGDFVGGQSPQSELAAPFEQLVDGEVAFKDEVTAILDLSDGIEA